MTTKDDSELLAAAKKKTFEYNRRVGERIRIFREMKGISQLELRDALGYKSKGSISLIETGARGLNKTTLRLAAKVLGTYPEVLTADQELTQDELRDLDYFIRVRKNPQHPDHANLMNWLGKSTK